jgi:class 3 adenylate cyclase/tetratricopeptide (TPR) repeat protein
MTASLHTFGPAGNAGRRPNEASPAAPIVSQSRRWQRRRIARQRRIVIQAGAFYARPVPTCTSCGRESAGDFAFCPYCGAQMAAATPARQVRKTVTVLFCDVVGSTSLGESVDPEALREILVRYFDRIKAIVEGHGGTVEKFVGDAVMAVFGVPVLHEDDALRAVRAASEILDALPELGVHARIGVNTGEVVTGTEERLATGDAVNVASRLERAAAPGTAVLGEETMRLLRGTIDVEPLPLLDLKGKSAPVTAYRLLAVNEEAPRRLDTPLVGRERELRGLRETFARAVADRSCQMFTVLGVPGVGKSRLAAEFFTRVQALVVRGRCISYGEGITYWPVIEVVTQLGAPPPGDAGAPLRSLLGESEEATSADEIALAFRRLLEEHARKQPLVCVLDDLHWGEAKFLDLVEHVADLSRDAPILLLCLARPELLDRRSGWGGGKWNSTTALLEPLDSAETDRLLDALGSGEGELRQRIAAAAEGNPLYLEETVALVRESGNGDVAVPPTIQALLAARLDQLDPAERSVLERGSVEGRVFHVSAIRALDGQEPELSARLVSLVRKDLVRPEATWRPGDEAYRFRHILIRDAAYDALPKSVRANFHERIAAWLEDRSDLGDVDEIVGYHLEQSACYRQELGQPHAALGGRAGERLARAGRRALWRGDNLAAVGLLGRAIALLPPEQVPVALELDLASAQPTPHEAAATSDEAARRARAAGDRAGEAAARAAAAFYRLMAGEGGVDEVDALAHAALPLLEETGDHASLVHVWAALGFGVANTHGRNQEWSEAAEQALRHARLAGQRPTHLFNLEATLVIGPTPADEALDKLDAVLPDVPHPQSLSFRAQLLAMLGRLDEARASASDARVRLRELTGGAEGEYALAEIAALSGDDEAAASHLRTFCDSLAERGQSSLLSTFAPLLGLALCALGRFDEAELQAQLGRELGEEHDVATQSLWRQVQARVDSHRGRHAEAEALAREAVALTERTDALNNQAVALCDLAEVLVGAGRTDEAVAVLREALERYERKKNVVAAARVHSRLATLRDRLNDGV